MTEKPKKILLVQDNPDYLDSLTERLKKDNPHFFLVQSAGTLKQALEMLSASPADLVLLELSLPDAKGLEAFEKIQNAYAHIPIVILTSLDDEILALRAVQKGAQDYLLKGEVEGKILPRVIRYAIERHRVKTELLNLSFMDDLTGLYNRRGFFALAEQQLNLAKRARRSFLLVLADLDGLKAINDLHGHPHGDMALVRAAELLRATFRKSDIVARLGGDEFAVLAIEAGKESKALIRERLHEAFQKFSKENHTPYPFSVSAGISFFDPDNPEFLDQLIAAADQEMYEEKRKKGSARPGPVPFRPVSSD